jgi:hypothetical protein
VGAADSAATATEEENKMNGTTLVVVGIFQLIIGIYIGNRFGFTRGFRSGRLDGYEYAKRIWKDEIAAGSVALGMNLEEESDG